MPLNEEGVSDLEQAKQEPTQGAVEPARKVKPWVCLLMVVMLLSILAGAIAVEGAGWHYLMWASHHPALRAKYDPHHWLTRIAILMIVLSICRAFIQAMLPPLVTFQAWRRVFLPFPWEPRERPEQVGTEPPVH